MRSLKNTVFLICIIFLTLSPARSETNFNCSNCNIVNYNFNDIEVDIKNKQHQSPWNFHDNFESQLLKEYTLTNKQGSAKSELYKIIKDKDGNHFLAITVKKNTNTDLSRTIGEKSKQTERTELSPPGKHVNEKIIWYGFKMRLPIDFKHTQDRVMITQFKSNFENMKKGPLFGIRFYDNGKEIRIGGTIGGTANTGHSPKHAKEKTKFVNFYLRDDGLYWGKLKYGDSEEIYFSKDINNPKIYINENDDFGLGEIPDKKICQVATDLKNTNNQVIKTFKNIVSSNFKERKYIKEALKRNLSCDVDNFKNLILPSKLFLKQNEWITIKIGLYITKSRNGFVKMYQNDNLIFSYDGITFDWDGDYIQSFPRIGPYRNSGSGNGYHDQTIHYDDFTVVSDKKTLDKYLGAYN